MLSSWKNGIDTITSKNLWCCCPRGFNHCAVHHHSPFSFHGSHLIKMQMHWDIDVMEKLLRTWCLWKNHWDVNILENKYWDVNILENNYWDVDLLKKQSWKKILLFRCHGEKYWNFGMKKLYWDVDIMEKIYWDPDIRGKYIETFTFWTNVIVMLTYLGKLLRCWHLRKYYWEVDICHENTFYEMLMTWKQIY